MRTSAPCCLPAGWRPRPNDCQRAVQTYVLIHRTSFVSVFLPSKAPTLTPVVSNLPVQSLQHQEPGCGFVGRRGLVIGVSDHHESRCCTYTSRRELPLQSPSCLHSKEELVHEKVEGGVWRALIVFCPLSTQLVGKPYMCPFPL